MAATKTVTKTAAKQPATKYAVPKKAPQKVPFKKEKKEKVMKPIFKGLVMSFSGTFINLDKPVPHEQVVKWITAHAAEYKREVTSDTTHLICSIEDYKKKTAQGKCLYSACTLTHLIFYSQESLGTGQEQMPDRRLRMACGLSFRSKAPEAIEM
jgi:hypothetical protein